MLYLKSKILILSETMVDVVCARAGARRVLWCTGVDECVEVNVMICV